MSSPDTEIDTLYRQIILDIINPLKNKPGAMLPILHEIQSVAGYVPDMAVPLIAEVLNVSRADVHGVISFYHFFRNTKPGSHIIQVCRAESCQAMGSSSLERYVKKTLHIDYHETTTDGNFSLEPVYCLGNCACSPSIAIDDEVIGDMDAKKFDYLLEELSHKTAKTGAL